MIKGSLRHDSVKSTGEKQECAERIQMQMAAAEIKTVQVGDNEVKI